jgi:hypothetical protein
MSVDGAVQALVRKHSPYFTVTAAGKVLCELNGHEFAARADVIAAFIK